MVNEDIVTVLRNSVNSGDSLGHAIQILVNSGYDATQVQEASKYVQGGTMQNLQAKPDEQLIMAQNRRMLNRNPNMQQPQQNQQTLVNPNQISQQRNQSMQHMQQAMNMNRQPTNPRMNQQPMNPQMNQQPMNPPNQPQGIAPNNQNDKFGAVPMDPNDIRNLTQPVQPQNNSSIISKQTMNLQNQQPPVTLQNQQTTNTQNQLQGNNGGIKLKKKSHKKEIILLIVLLFLIGVLGSTVFFRASILNFLSG